MSRFFDSMRLLRLALAVASAATSTVQPAGVVGTGTPESCTETALDAALAGGGLVSFNCGTAPKTITVTSPKTVTLDTRIDGGSLITVDGAHNTRILVFETGTTAALRNLSIANGGDSEGFSGANSVVNRGSLTIENCIFSRNFGERGGAVDNSGTLVVSDSTFVANEANAKFFPLPAGVALGGAIYNTGSLTVISSVFAENFAYQGGGAIDSRGGTLTVTNCTFAGNTAGGQGGAIFGSSSTLVTNTTISNNSTYNGAAVAGPATLRNTIIANSIGSAYSPPVNCSGLVIDGGNNLQFPGTSCGATIPVADPLLAPLASNGGVTQTMALLPGSPAIDAGNNATCPATDQRGIPRVDGDGDGSAVCDIGAYEFAPAALPSDDYADLWWNPDTAGLVLNIHQNPAGVAFAVWYTYDIDHKDMWLTLQGDWVAPDTFAGTLYRTTGPAIGGPSDPALVTLFPVGSGILSFTDADNGTFSYSVSGVADSKPIARFLF